MGPRRLSVAYPAASPRPYDEKSAVSSLSVGGDSYREDFSDVIAWFDHPPEASNLGYKCKRAGVRCESRKDVREWEGRTLTLNLHGNGTVEAYLKATDKPLVLPDVARWMGYLEGVFSYKGVPRHIVYI